LPAIPAHGVKNAFFSIYAKKEWHYHNML